MVNYTCLRCGYETTIKTILVRHLSRKNKCIPTNYDVDIEHFKQYILEGKHTEDYLISIKKSKNNPKKDSESKTEHKCAFCEKYYSTKSNLYKHFKKCKERKKDEEVKSSMTELVHIFNKQLEKRDKQIDEQNKQIQELIKKAGINNSTVNIQNNIKLLNYNKTDTSHLTDNDILKCLNHSNFCIPYLIEKIHFDTEKPENHNVYISNLP